MREAVERVLAAPTRRRSDGHPHAGHGRARGHPPDRRPHGAATARARPDDLRPRRVRLRGPARRRERLPAQGHPPEELLAAVEIIARGDALLAPAITRAVIEQFARHPTPPQQPPAKLEHLTARETEVLHLLARGLANAEIAKELYISEATVRTHVLHVLQKLDLRDRIHAVIYAYETGLTQPGTHGSG